MNPLMCRPEVCSFTRAEKIAIEVFGVANANLREEDAVGGREW